MRHGAELDEGSPWKGPEPGGDTCWNRTHAILLLTPNLIRAQQSRARMLHIRQDSMDPCPVPWLVTPGPLNNQFWPMARTMCPSFISQ